VLVSAALLVLAFGAAFWLILSEQERRQNDALARGLVTHARVVAAVLAEHWPDLHLAFTAGVFREVEAEDLEIAVLDTNGQVWRGPSGGTSAAALPTAPEIVATLRDGAAALTRPWGPDNRPYLVAAVRIGSADAPLGVVWLARPAWTLASDRPALARQLSLLAGVIVVLTFALALVVLGVRQRVLARLVAGARRLSAGELDAELNVRGADELAPLSTALNTLRSRLRAQVDLLDGQRRTLETILNQLQEGVVVAGSDGRIALINPAATRLLNVKMPPDGPAGLIGRTVESCIPQHPLQRQLLGLSVTAAVDEALAERRGQGRPAVERKPVTIAGPDHTVHLLADASDLTLGPSGAAGRGTHARVLVLTDVSELQRTIQLRTDFVANASHELRTPLSTIRAAVETLANLDLKQEAAAAQQFLQVISRHSARLEQLVTDLLDLSRLESPSKPFAPERVALPALLIELRHRFAESADRKHLRWDVQVTPPETTTVIANTQLLRLALDNLLDNALKFTPADGRVELRIRREPHAVTFEVADTGCGIPLEEQERVFERFYQVERGRSGSARGTGLGLSIVRHAVGAMRGTVRLTSTVGTGTNVTLTIPQPSDTHDHASETAPAAQDAAPTGPGPNS
jgi:signal transduction histidine kinase